ncbi:MULTISPECIES: SpoIID/LytB domain-containing protein [unclassified Microcystis]|uniref:SpoIID/LytB domain-containing protein n=1 Tax=unclassified Microcystis TaxID=2643300 RepID=UPI001197CCAC|nr:MULTISPECIES: SpoIID/LytB domain-containing protein [unclassified Microcystis]MCA2925287.1 SpoIID/LytB domain-containing protein [Microcystis sp. M020S1]MCA2936243.1 SpoIID/LytB domain-containing protein [Microcystis sp. M015S1]MCA2621803.1 SpoIID/LytB domain-containing protein [Microcystis sp. M099S2]MCA2652131.1 SpoIID/LytB domain-containing protein [Microcystis sp. M065S2]MCA2680734.1 SpoIID/LytB domain-containing protein [Microcystis sp. M043S2]
MVKLDKKIKDGVIKVKFAASTYFSLLRHCAVPLLSIATFTPILLTYLAKEKPETPQPQANLETAAFPSPIIPSPIAPLTAPSPKLAPSPQSSPSAPKKLAPSAHTSPNTSPNTSPAAAVKPVTRQPLVVPANYTPPALEIRVAIKRDVASVLIGVNGPAVITDRQGRGLKTIATNEGLPVIPGAKGLKMGDLSLPEVIFVQPTSADGLVYVDDSWYRGKVLLVAQGDRLLVVNHVNLEAYLYSVVGSEMHSTAPMHALKAQAIAARSYALVHIIRPANAWFHLGNSQRWQVYKGIRSEYQSTHQAVNATAGQILSYKGGVVESLYAATDEIVAWAHGGRGMSQTGAYKLAEKGLDYQQILGNYYPGVGLARLVLQN